MYIMLNLLWAAVDLTRLLSARQNSRTAVCWLKAHADVTLSGGDRFNAAESRVFQRKKRGLPPGYGEGSCVPDPFKLLQDVPLITPRQDFDHIGRVVTLAHSGGCAIIVPRGVVARAARGNPKMAHVARRGARRRQFA
jgi:hypothetical protein